MTNNIKSKVEITVNIIIAVAVVIVAGIAVKRYLVPETSRAGSTPQIIVGGKINVPNVNWEENKKTLVFFLKKDCVYCTSSAPFFRQLIDEALKRNVKLLAIVPYSVEEGRAYTKSLGLTIENVQSGSLTNYKIPGTPTMLLLDNTGTVKSVWIGACPRSANKKSETTFFRFLKKQLYARIPPQNQRTRLVMYRITAPHK